MITVFGVLMASLIMDSFNATEGSKAGRYTAMIIFSMETVLFSVALIVFVDFAVMMLLSR